MSSCIRLNAMSLRYLFVISLPLIINACASMHQTPSSTLVPEPVAKHTETSEIRTARTLQIAAVGDIMLGTDFPDDRLPPEDGKQMLSAIANLLNTADITFGNLEGVLLDDGEPVKRCHNPSLCYLFRTPSHYVKHLQQAGFDVMSLANNHARDFGEQGRSSSMQLLAEASIQHSGREGDIASWEVQGLNIALIAYAPFGGSNDMLDLNAVAHQVRQLKQSHDLVLVSFHGGAEGSKALHVPFEQELYYGENRGDVVAFAHHAIDAGADLILGHGPHVPRAIELYKQRLVAYSLGNFSTYRGFNIRDDNGLAPILLVEMAKNGQFVRGQIVSAIQERPMGTQLDPEHRAARLIQSLTQIDFPDTPLDIDDDGHISLRTSPAHAVSTPP